MQSTTFTILSLRDKSMVHTALGHTLLPYCLSSKAESELCATRQDSECPDACGFGLNDSLPAA